MKTCYFDLKTRAIADLCPPIAGSEIPGWQITRINVPFRFRGVGLASALLKQIIADADEARVDLSIGVNPSDGLDREQLTAWYMRHGFKRHESGYLVRRWSDFYKAVPVETFRLLAECAEWGYANPAMPQMKAYKLRPALDFVTKLLQGD